MPLGEPLAHLLGQLKRIFWRARFPDFGLLALQYRHTAVLTALLAADRLKS